MADELCPTFDRTSVCLVELVVQIFELPSTPLAYCPACAIASACLLRPDELKESDQNVDDQSNA